MTDTTEKQCRAEFDKWLPGYAKQEYSFYTDQDAIRAIKSSFGKTLYDAWQAAWNHPNKPRDV